MAPIQAPLRSTSHFRDPAITNANVLSPQCLHYDLDKGSSMPPVSPSTGVAITNPLVLYRALLATKKIDPDPSQHRLAIHLQKLYEHLKDYEPIVQYNHRIREIGRAIGSTPGQKQQNGLSEQAPRRAGVLASLFENKQARDGLALTRVLTSHESAMLMDSPKGLMLHGEVGTGDWARPPIHVAKLADSAYQERVCWSTCLQTACPIGRRRDGTSRHSCSRHLRSWNN